MPAPDVQKKLKDRAEELLREGVIGFGEMTAEHYSGVTPYQYAWRTIHSISAGRYRRPARRPIDLHRSGPKTRRAGGLKSPQPAEAYANIAAFERLLRTTARQDHLAHAGADGTGPERGCASACSAHANLYGDQDRSSRAGNEYRLRQDRPSGSRATEFPDRFVVGSDQHHPNQGP
jgi:hypothetical protein